MYVMSEIIILPQIGSLRTIEVPLKQICVSCTFVV